jgi:hypothetical protein
MGGDVAVHDPGLGFVSRGRQGVHGVAVGVDLPASAGVGELSAQCEHILRWRERIIPAVEDDHLGANLVRCGALGWGKDAVEAGRSA